VASAQKRLDGSLATIGGPLEYLDKSIKDLRGCAEKAKRCQQI